MKRVLLISLSIILIVLVLTGCFSIVKKWSNDDIRVTLEKNTTLTVYTQKKMDSIKIIFDKVLSRGSIDENSDLLFIYKEKDGKTELSLAGKGESIPKDFELMTITGDFPDIVSLNIESESFIISDDSENLSDSMSGSGDLDVPYLLGDFNFDGKVDIFDFTEFVDVFGEVSKYDVLFDLGGTALKEPGWGEWSGFFNKANPDGEINFIDFAYFGRNFFLDRPDITDLGILIMQFINISRLELADNYGPLLADSVDTKRQGKPIENYSKSDLITVIKGAFANYEVNVITIESYNTTGEDTLAAEVYLDLYINADNIAIPSKDPNYYRTLYFEAVKSSSLNDPWKMNYFEEQY